MFQLEMKKVWLIDAVGFLEVLSVRYDNGDDVREEVH